MDTRTALLIAKEIDHADIRTDARDILTAFDGNDFTVEFGCTEYRIIHEDDIEEIHRREIEELVDDCYNLEKIKSEMGNVGNYLTFDYDALARDSRTSDGYGHHFSHYDGNEIEVGSWHIFRIN